MIYKKLLITALSIEMMLSSAAFGSCGDNTDDIISGDDINCWDCSTATSSCTARLTGTTLNITGTGDMADYYGDSIAPWSAKKSSITNLVIGDGITSIGSYAFLQASHLEDIQISNSVKTINIGAFEQTRFSGTLVIPESVNFINGFAFSYIGDAKIMIEGTSQLISSSFINTQRATIYCEQSLDCSNKGIYGGVDYQGNNTVTYEKQSGVYRLEDGTMFASPNDMMNGVNACVDLDSCKATVLQNKGYCTGEACAAMVAAENTNHPIEYNNKSYASIDDLLKGKHMPKRIYTLDEANTVAGAVNRISIKYR